ncbi:hypothetical protein COU56_01785 [Candidatus Pacearchaeota archaeon CG10_big_fil_rev_8_21_14_0_10_31_9]|nr:MAG: hypothetical protein AUJ62_03640 [Candidatus Pacearchaeota archaeon CG1_02_32_21]PIN95380.1 MAG: hypothetical protein COU56_01785 [Candidatus Pacearchaeota archaeon CG10_big_fil_rev_8_21_14_0_10_31_9]PIZ82692.1 MAG: hypothetical protein COX97_03490 [Candidatus Pacearchaeota archaeon CG_4_10_14_0_2_um_filter_05_32_18]
MTNYNQLVEKISKSSGLSVEEINRMVETKCAKLSGLISKEGSAQIVASELGISFDKDKLKINELMSGMKKVNLIGKVISIAPIRNFTTKSGVESKVMAMTLADETGNVRTVLWDTNHISLFETNKIKEGEVIEISNGSIRNDELHLGSFSDIKVSKEQIANVKTESFSPERTLESVKAGQNIKNRAFIVQVFEPRFFEICPQCNKKAVSNTCVEHGVIVALKRALLTLVLDDGSENMRGVLFSEGIKGLGIEDGELENKELFEKRKNDLLGEEFLFEGSVRSNNVFNTSELIINKVSKVEIDPLIEQLRV